jgi:hypothetical protein
VQIIQPCEPVVDLGLRLTDDDVVVRRACDGAEVGADLAAVLGEDLRLVSEVGQDAGEVRVLSIFRGDPQRLPLPANPYRGPSIDPQP